MTIWIIVMWLYSGSEIVLGEVPSCDYEEVNKLVNEFEVNNDVFVQGWGCYKEQFFIQRQIARGINND